MSKIFQISVRENRKINEHHYILTAHPSENIRVPLPGQFFMISASDGIDPLLKRPFSLHRWLGEDFQFMYRVVGRGTSLLKWKKPGEILDGIGPLGNGFPLPEEGGDIPVIVAGGIGVAPVFALAESLAAHEPVFFYGARTGNDILCAEELRSLGISPMISTDDGTLGKKGTVIDHVSDFFMQNAQSSSSYLLYACGPKSMLRSLSLVMEKHQIRGYMALEESMACGIGSCLGCVVKTAHGYKRVCKEGPVFPVEEIVW